MHLSSRNILPVLVRQVAGRCRTTTILALAFVTSQQTVTWEVVSLDRAACKPEEVRIAAKPREGAARATQGSGESPPDGSFKPGPGESTAAGARPAPGLCTLRSAPNPKIRT